MARDRKLSSDFWTCEAVIDCAMMTRLLFLGLQSFADDFCVQPLRPRTIRMQVFPGDPLDNDQVRAMIEELAARGLVRIYTVQGQEYLAIVDWERLHRVGKRARRLYPACPDEAPSAGGMDKVLPASTPTPRDHSKPLQTTASGAPDIGGEAEERPAAVGPPADPQEPAAAIALDPANRVAVPAAA
ncbi:MAG: hypothetical protein FJX20_15780 [Alphaproteobacteria bacterium]|nr:hypothetical protein [Alphaproteobacteria bacterium]